MKDIENTYKLEETTITPLYKSKCFGHSTHLSLAENPSTISSAYSSAKEKSGTSSTKKNEFTNIYSTVSNLHEKIGIQLCSLIDNAKKIIYK